MNWDDFRVFDAVVRCQSVRAAARELGVDHSAVSRRIGRLESALGTKLLVRRSGGVVVTDAGEEVRRTAATLTQEILGVQRRVEGWDSELSGRLRISTHPVLGLGFVMPTLTEFRQLHPNIEIDLDLAPHSVSLSQNEAEVAVRVTDVPPGEAIARRVAGLGYAVYVAQSYLGEHDPFERPQDCAWVGWDPSGPYPAALKDDRFSKVPVEGRFQDIFAQLEAAKAGFGLAALPCVLADTQSELRRVSDAQVVTSVFVLRHPDHRSTARVRSFFEFAAEDIERRAATLEGTASEASSV